jgi:hypothetical protein
MALVGRRDGRNFGWGRQLSYAGPQAIRDMFGGGHYGTVKAHSDRWQAFVRWCRSKNGPGFNDARQIDRQTLLEYAGYLRGLVEHGDLAISTAQNRLSSVNRAMAALRGDQYVKLPSPSKALGMQRTGVRHSVPQGQTTHRSIRSLKHFAHMSCNAVLPSSSWRARPECACARPYWQTCRGLSVSANSKGRSTSRMALKVAVQVRRQWMIMFAMP